MKNRGKHKLFSLWPHRWAWGLVCATFSMIWIGGLVTAADASMAFCDLRTSDGHFTLFYPWFNAAGDKFIEHGLRLLGASVGVLAILLVIVVYRLEQRVWVRRLSLVILAGVVLQRVLGGMRVVLDERILALVHGCIEPLFFAICVAMVVFTSRKWHTIGLGEAQDATSQARKTQPAKKTKLEETSIRLRKLFQVALLFTGLVYVQLVLGAIVRHAPHMIGHRSAAAFQSAVYLHVLLASLLLVHAVLLVWRCRVARTSLFGSVCLALLLLVQIGLGAGAWLVNYGMPAWATSLVGEVNFRNTAADVVQTTIVASHIAVGSLIIVVAFAISLMAARRLDRMLPG